MNSCTEQIIELSDICRVYFTDEIETHALAGIDLKICSGEYVVISGPSGCGKSTLLNLLGLLDTPTRGSYSLRGKLIEEIPADQKAMIRNQEFGFVFQAFNLISDMTVYENVELPLSYRAGLPRSYRAERVMNVLNQVGMGPSKRSLSEPALRWAATTSRCRSCVGW